MTLLLAPMIFLAVALVRLVVQAVAPELEQLLGLLDTLLRLTMMAFLVVPVAEVRKLLGGLPDIPLPGGHSIRAGRWFSWLVAGLILAFGYFAGIMKLSDDPATYQAQLALAYGYLGILANVVYDKFWKEQVGFQELVVGETLVSPPPGEPLPPAPQKTPYKPL